MTCGPVLLHDEWSPYGDLTVIPYFAYFRRGEPFGVIRALLSPQDMLNKVRSQELHEVNLTANGGLDLRRGFAGEFPVRRRFGRRGVQVGPGVWRFGRGRRSPPAKIPPNPLPQGLELLAQHADMAMKDISGRNRRAAGDGYPEGLRGRA